MNTLIFQGILSGYNGLKDGGMKIVIDTQEMPRDMAANLIGYHNSYIEILIKEGEDEITDDDIQELINAEFDEFDKRQGKSPSKRLRNVFYILWQQDSKGFEEFKDYYNHLMEKVIDHYKEKIQDE